MKRLISTLSFTVICTAICASVASAGVYDELNAAEKKTIQSGGQVVRLKDVAGAPWPEVTVYQRLAATAEEGLAVLSDYELQKTYVPDLKDSKIRKRVNATVTLVDYKLHVVLTSVRYTLENKLSTDGSVYRVDWKMTEGEQIEEIRGKARFENLGTGAIMAYDSFIRPATTGFRDKAIASVKAGAAAIVKQVEKERTGNPALLEKQLATLRTSFNR